MDSRSIDLAKTASIDMMSLNNKVVNMRQTVKRTKVRVINKLCKHISSLKKKKGTEEQKAKNLRKAQRFIEEIDSIKKLKEDKVSKYALANTLSFKDIAKMSTSPGTRALARLTDHALMQKMVSEFREQHNDWRDLAAFLLVKQTGRRFKTKKQKQKKLSRCVENINASETMTKAYIQERFGKEGLTKAEQRFQRKKRKPVPKSDAQNTDTDEKNEMKKQKTSDTSPQSVMPEEHTHSEQERPAVKKVTDSSISQNVPQDENRDDKRVKNVKDIENDVKFSRQNSSSDSEKDNTESNGNSRILVKTQISTPSKNKVFTTSNDSSDSSSESNESETPNMDQDNNVKDVNQTMSKEYSSKSKKENNDSEKDDAPKKSECVVKELKLGEEDSEDDAKEFSETDSDSNDTADSDSESERKRVSQRSNSSDEGGASEEDVMPRTSKRKEKKKKKTPEFMTVANKKSLSDPFFAGSDDEEEGTMEDVGMNEELDDNEDNMSDDDFSSGKSKVESMFYNPDVRDKVERRKGSRFERVGNKGNLNRRGGFDKFDSRHRGRGTSRGRGRGTSRGRGRGGNFSDRSRGRGFGRERSHYHDEDSQAKRFKHIDKTPQRFDARQESKSQKYSGAGGGYNKEAAVDKGPKEKLHPSWEASKKRKAEQSGIAAFKGSKITFDDD